MQWNDGSLDYSRRPGLVKLLSTCPSTVCQSPMLPSINTHAALPGTIWIFIGSRQQGSTVRRTIHINVGSDPTRDPAMSGQAASLTRVDTSVDMSRTDGWTHVRQRTALDGRRQPRPMHVQSLLSLRDLHDVHPALTILNRSEPTQSIPTFLPATVKH